MPSIKVLDGGIPGLVNKDHGDFMMISIVGAQTITNFYVLEFPAVQRPHCGPIEIPIMTLDLDIRFVHLPIEQEQHLIRRYRTVNPKGITVRYAQRNRYQCRQVRQTR